MYSAAMKNIFMFSDMIFFVFVTNKRVVHSMEVGKANNPSLDLAKEYEIPKCYDKKRERRCNYGRRNFRQIL